MAQTELVCEALKQRFPEHTYEILVISTRGDRIQDVALREMGQKGIFVKEIEEKLLKKEIHLGVHSMKDMPSENTGGLIFTKTWKREDPRDVLILREAGSLGELREGAVIGTGSMRRECQLKKIRPDIRIAGIRGNVDTRLRKMEEQKLDGILLAAAGLKRLGMEGVITQYLEPEEMVPACAQGALALEIREDNRMLQKMLDSFGDVESMICVEAERSFLQAVGGGCHVPAGAYCRRTGLGKGQDGCPASAMDGRCLEQPAGERTGDGSCLELTAGVRTGDGSCLEQPAGVGTGDGSCLELTAVLGTGDGSRLEQVKLKGTQAREMGEEAAKILKRRLGI